MRPFLNPTLEELRGYVAAGCSLESVPPPGLGYRRIWRAGWCAHCKERVERCECRDFCHGRLQNPRELDFG
jgi:hypothetical protein